MAAVESHNWIDEELEKWARRVEGALGDGRVRLLCGDVDERRSRISGAKIVVTLLLLSPQEVRHNI